MGGRALPVRLYLEPFPRRDGRRRRPGRLGEPRTRPRAGARMAAAARGPEALRLEEREMAHRPRVRGEERARVLGGAGLSRARGALRGGAVLLPGGSEGRARALARAARVLAVRAEVRRPSAHDGLREPGVAARASGPGTSARAHPAGAEAAGISVHGPPHDGPQRPVQRRALIFDEALDRAPGVDPSAPQDLVG